MIDALIANPAFGGTVLPLVVALVVGGLIRVIGGPDRGPQFAIAGAAVGFLAAFLWIEGPPPVPPTTGKQKIFYMAVVALLLGWAIDSKRRPGGSSRLAHLVLPALALLWLTWRLLLSGPDLRLLLELAALWLAAVLVQGRLMRLDRRGALVPGVQVLVAAIGLSAIAFLGASVSLALLAAAVAAGLGGVLIWAFLGAITTEVRFDFGALGWLGAAGALLLVADVVVLFTPDVNRWALAILLLVFLADQVPVRLRLRGALDRAARPVVLALIAAAPAVAAVGIAMLTGDTSPY